VGSRIIATRAAAGAHMDLRFHTQRDQFAMIIDANQNVGIGTDNPNSNLHIKSTSDVKLTLETDEDSDCWINLSGATSEASIGYEPATNSLRFANAADGVTSNVRMTIDASGNVGIGATEPNSSLEVNKTISFSSVDTFAQLNIKTTAGALGNMLNIGVDETDELAFLQSLKRGVGLKPLILQRYGGNVGIGTDNPTQELSVYGQINVNSTDYARIEYARNDTNIWSAGLRDTDDYYVYRESGAGNVIIPTGILQGSSDSEIKTSPIRKHSNTISTNTTIDSGENAIASGPISVATGVTLTINGNMTVV